MVETVDLSKSGVQARQQTWDAVWLSVVKIPIRDFGLLCCVCKGRVTTRDALAWLECMMISSLHWAMGLIQLYHWTLPCYVCCMCMYLYIRTHRETGEKGPSRLSHQQSVQPRRERSKLIRTVCTLHFIKVTWVLVLSCSFDRLWVNIPPQLLMRRLEICLCDSQLTYLGLDIL